jgi:hypothetical protein
MSCCGVSDGLKRVRRNVEQSRAEMRPGRRKRHRLLSEDFFPLTREVVNPDASIKSADGELASVAGEAAVCSFRPGKR